MVKQAIDQKTGEELFKLGDVAPTSGEYVLVNENGDKTNYDINTLDEGEKVPDVKDKCLLFRMVATCLEEEETC